MGDLRKGLAIVSQMDSQRVGSRECRAVSRVRLLQSGTFRCLHGHAATCKGPCFSTLSYDMENVKKKKTREGGIAADLLCFLFIKGSQGEKKESLMRCQWGGAGARFTDVSGEPPDRCLSAMELLTRRPL